MSHFYLIDASHFIFRAYYALPPLARYDGVPCGALYGFLAMLLKLTRTQKPKGLGIVFDSKEETFRNKLFKAYKANRLEPPEDLIPQFALVREACLAFGLPCIAKPGFEADDLLASYAKHIAHAGHTAALVSSDKDLMQLLSDKVKLFDPMKEKWLEAEDVLKKFGVKPEDVLNVQALMGDTSDNIPGVPGIGPKTAASLITSFKNLEGIYANINNIKSARIQNLLQTHKEQAFLSRTLAELKDDVPQTVALADLTFKGFQNASAEAFLEQQGFETLLKRFRAQSGTQTTQKWRVHLVKTEEDLNAFLKVVHQTGLCSVTPLQTSSKNTHQAEDALAQQAGFALATPLCDIALITPETLQDPSLQKAFFDILDAPFVLKITYDAKALSTKLAQQFSAYRTLHPFEDAALAYYLLAGPQKTKTPQALLKLLGDDTPVLEEKSAQNLESFTKACNEKDAPALEAHILDAATLAKTWQALAQALQKKKLLALYQNLEKPLIAALRDMETEGIALSIEHLQKLGAFFQKELDAKTQEIWKISGKTFNVASPKQLSHVLFEDMKLKPPAKKGKSGTLSTSSDVLAGIDHPIIAPLLDVRQFAKLKSTYVDSLLSEINPKTHRVHTTFQNMSTSTGRLSSIAPNLQNIPVRTSEGRMIREAFVAREGCAFLALDYSQIELRLLAHMGNIAPLIEAFKAGEDIHTKTASEMFEKAKSDVTPDERRTAKMINFGIIYGMSDYGLSDRLSISREKANAYIKHYMKAYTGIEDYMKNTIDGARSSGYVTTLWGRRCYIKEMRHQSYVRRTAAERLAINAPLQGTSADLIKKAMLEIKPLLEETPLKLLLQIHDELLFEGPQNAIDTLKDKLIACMQNVETLRVPLVVEGVVGKTWAAVS